MLTDRNSMHANIKDLFKLRHPNLNYKVILISKNLHSVVNAVSLEKKISILNCHVVLLYGSE